ncbi:MAG: ATP-binding protein [Acutalibacteraceae bacterium]|nr:ATP-binding protein [Acutalibacteraceae bacterium]
MYPDGICKVTEKKYSKSIAYDDINYQLAQADDKTAIFENWCDFLNYFDATVSVQLSFVNRGTCSGGAEEVVAIPAQNDAFNSIRTEYADMLKHQLAKGNNGFVKSKYITFSVEADNLNAAKARLARIETDILNNFKVLGAAARPMTGYERLEALHSVFHPEGEPFRFSWDWLTPSGLTTKDFIAPSSFRFGEGRYFRMGRKIGAVSFLEILAPELNDRMLADILDLETGIVVNLHIKSIDQTEAIKTIKRKITDLDKMKIEEQKKAVRSGYDMDIIPSDLAMFGGEAKNLLQDLQSRNERMFLLTFLVVNLADTKRKLENDIFAAAGIAQKYNCALTRLDYQQEAGLMSSVPLGENLIPIQRGLTTSSTAIFIPFITQELFQQGAALYYGLNALSSNMILCDRKRLKNPNGLILGTPGSGKSFAAKREITNAFLITDDDIIICDPEAEYYPLVRRLHGQVIRISPTSTQYVNPMDINLNYSEDDNPLALKSDFLLSLCELVIGGKEGLMPVEKTVIDRSVRNVYRPFLAAPDPAKMPILGDLYDELLRQPEPEAARVAAALELYVSGSLNVFNHRTNVELSNRLVCFGIKQLGKQLKKLGMLIVQDQVWNRVTINRAEKKSTRYYMDEFHLLLKEEQTAAYSVEIWKRFRKWGGIPTAITQNVKDLLSSREVENIFENSDFVLMLNQAQGDREILARQLNISPQQMKYVTHTEAGEGLIFYGNVVLPFLDRFPQNTELYRVMTTRPEEVGGT